MTYPAQIFLKPIDSYIHIIISNTLGESKNKNSLSCSHIRIPQHFEMFREYSFNISET